MVELSDMLEFLAWLHAGGGMMKAAKPAAEDGGKPPSPAQARGRANAATGRWGEEVTARFLRGKGWKIVARNARPCPKDLRCEIDLIAQDGEGRIVFVEVKTHQARSPRAGRLARITRQKKATLLRACSNWVLRNDWHGNFRFDVVEVYGAPQAETPPEIDHIENVPLFPPKWRFWH